MKILSWLKKIFDSPKIEYNYILFEEYPKLGETFWKKRYETEIWEAFKCTGIEPQDGGVYFSKSGGWSFCNVNQCYKRIKYDK